VHRWCPTHWPAHFGCSLAAGSFVRIRDLDLTGGVQTAWVQPIRSRTNNLYKVRLSELHAPAETTPLHNPGCQACRASCPLEGTALTRFKARILPLIIKNSTITPSISRYMAAIGARGGKRRTKAKLAHLARARAAWVRAARARRKKRKNLAKNC